MSWLSSVPRAAAVFAVAGLASALAAAVFPTTASADSTEDFPIPRRMIATTCDAEQYLAAVRDTSPVYYQRYMIDYNNHPVEHEYVQDEMHRFFAMSPAERRDYSEHFYDGGKTGPALWAAWPNKFKIFYNNKGVVAKATDVCNNYPRGDMSVWDWS